MSHLNIKLTKKEIAETTQYGFGEKWVEGSLNWQRAEKWIKKYLIIVSDESSTPYNCCSKGIKVFKRKDGKPITQNDVDALNEHSLGQVNNVSKSVGEMTVTQEWLCDSSD